MSQPIKNNSKLLYLQARQLFEQAKSKFEDGSIKSDASLIQSVFNSFQAFFTSMGKPNMVPRYAPEEGPPWSEDYNSMMNEIRQDLELLFQEVDILGRSLYTDFNHNMIQHDILMGQYQTVLDKMRDLETFAGIGDAGVDFGRDDFLNKDKIDYARIAGTPLEIVDGAVTLPQISRENVAEKATITIVTGNRQQDKFILGTESNGFPGNNTEIHSVTDDILTNRNYIPTFLGEEDNHGDYSVVLDGNPNTWFEYEKVNVREQDKIRGAKNLGWSYQVHENQSIEWAEDPDGGILKLHMQMVLEEETIINQINCNMYTPPNYGAKGAIVKNILVSDGKSAPVSILTSDKKDDQYSFHFPPVKAKVISFQFEQPNKYITDIGHIFYEKKMQSEDNSEYAMDVATKKYQYAPRVEGPLISLEDLGINVKVTDSSVSAEYPSVKATNNQITNIGETINRLTSNIDMETIDMGVEKFEGFRWAIGIRDIEVYSCEYAEEGELVTYPFYFENPLDKISLNVNENVPSTFTTNDAMKYDWLTYYISIDDGATWNPITPLTHQSISADQPPKIYTVHTVETADQQLDNKQAYLESEYPVYSLRLKIVGRRPSDYTTEGFMLKDSAGTTNSFNQSSPIVNSYLLDIKTKIEASDSDESLRIATHIDDLTGENRENPDGSGGNGNGGIDYGGVDGGSGNNGNTGGVSPEVIGPNPWGDDNNNGRPNWDDPEHVYYIPPNIRPTPEWEPPGRPEDSDYPKGGIPPVAGGPLEDDNGDGIPNYKDPDWRPPLTAEITNKKIEWCSDEDLHIKGNLYTGNNLLKAELYVNGKITQTIPLSGKYANYEFVIPANTLEPSTAATIVVRVYDSMKSFFDTDVINIIDCTNMAEEDRPQEQGSNDEIRIVIDKKISKMCECDTLSFYGTVQGPNPIQALVIRINGNVIDMKNMGTPPVNDPCLSNQVVPQFLSAPVEVQVDAKQITDEELLAIDDFGEWLEAFEEREDCGCRNKKKRQRNTFQMQSAPIFTAMTTNEEIFQATVPYWKLRELGAVAGKNTKIEITAIDITNQQVVESFEFLVEDCKNPPYDEDGNPRIADCKGLESVEVYYYDGEKQSIQSAIIPSNAIPYKINNGQGTEVTVGWREEAKSPILMVTSGWDGSGYAFQLHAVAVNYLDEYGKSYKIWASALSEKSEGIKNGDKMLGDASRQPIWVEDILTGDYSTAPSLSGINDYVDFVFDTSMFGNTLCEMDTIPNFDIGSNTQSNYPPSRDSEGAPYSCWNATHVVFQYYDDQFNMLRVLKMDITENGKDIYTIKTKNGNVELAIGWVGYFNAPAIQIKSATGDQNVLLTSLGVTFQDYYGDSQTMWVEQLRYKTNGVNNADMVLGELKDISALSWLNGNVVDYESAAYIGKQGDLVSYSLNKEVVTHMCPPARTIDHLLNLDFEELPDKPSLSFSNLPEENEICFDTEEIIVKGIVNDQTGLKEIKYGILLNGMDYLGPYIEEVEGFDYTVDFQIRPEDLEIGDTIRVTIEATNQYNVMNILSDDLWVVNCGEGTPILSCGHDYYYSSTGESREELYTNLGANEGRVTIRLYNMNLVNDYDKVEFYYNDQLVGSSIGYTPETPITFDYRPVNENYLLRVVQMTKGQSSFNYRIECPVPFSE